MTAADWLRTPEGQAQLRTLLREVQALRTDLQAVRAELGPRRAADSSTSNAPRS